MFRWDIHQGKLKGMLFRTDVLAGNIPGMVEEGAPDLGGDLSWNFPSSLFPFGRGEGFSHALKGELCVHGNEIIPQTDHRVGTAAVFEAVLEGVALLGQPVSEKFFEQGFTEAAAGVRDDKKAAELLEVSGYSCKLVQSALKFSQLKVPRTGLVSFPEPSKEFLNEKGQKNSEKYKADGPWKKLRDQHIFISPSPG
jgi:hypothetical protein